MAVMAMGWIDGNTATVVRGAKPLRAFDLLICVAALIFLLPLIAAIALILMFQNGGSILFGHRRIGKNGQEFICYKFRTMVVDAEERLAELLASDPVARAEWAVDDKLRVDPRVTFGRALPAQVEPRRTATGLQRPGGQHERRRTAADR